ncbi:MAG: ornithine carbamoyltransferase [Bacteroidota bacterium]
MNNQNLNNRPFLKLLDFTSSEIQYLLDLSAKLKSAKKAGQEKKYLSGKNIALIFEKASTRTRCAFEVAAYDQGAHITYLGPTGSQIGHKESIQDTARVLGRMYDGIQYRGFGQQIVEEIAKNAGVPVWNGLTNEFHPTQVLADFLTMQENLQKPLSEMRLCYLGDARNNMGNSLLIGAAKTGINFSIAAPSKYFPGKKLVSQARNIASTTKADISIGEDVQSMVADADYLYTDVWVSMGEADNVWEERIKSLMPYQVNQKVLEMTGNPEVKFLHCLPSFHNRETKIGEKIFEQFGLEAMEVTDEVFESPHSLVFEEAENRLHTIKAVMVATLGE